MSDKEKNLKTITDCGVVAIVRVSSAQEAVDVCQAIAKGGVKPIGDHDRPRRHRRHQGV